MTAPEAFDVLTLPQVRTWRTETGGSTVLQFLGEGGSFAHAAAVLWLCWPELVEVRGCVLFAESFDQQGFEDWWRELEGDQAAVEGLVNHVHLWDVFRDVDEVPPEALEAFAFRLADVWRAVLPLKMPGRLFTVTVNVSEEEYGPTLSFTSRPDSA